MNRRAPGSGGREAGFTLVELLVAVTLLGLVMILVFGGLRLGVRAWQAGNVGAEHLAETEPAATFLRARLEAAQPSLYFDEAGNARAGIEGDSDRIVFLSAFPPHLGGDYFIVDIHTEDIDGKRALILERQLAKLAESESLPAAHPTPTILLEDIAEVRFAYFGEGVSGALAWQPEWTGEYGAPLLIRIDVAYPPDDGRLWPSIIVAPKLDG